MTGGDLDELAGGLRRIAAAHGAPAFVAVDGWSGSGKTTLGDALGARLGAPVVHQEDLVTGWYGLQRSVERLVTEVLQPLAAGRPATWRRWDWAAGALGGEEDTALAAPLSVVEGCGAGSAPVRPWLAALVWLEVPEPERLARLRARADWSLYEPWLEVWAAQERALRAGDEPRDHADVVVAHTGAGVALRWRGGYRQG
ncbi:MAG: AAA family ATPase [Actinomycetota bacterium]|nr:AAA family ATPase [Actinomycetota bacterium]